MDKIFSFTPHAPCHRSPLASYQMDIVGQSMKVKNDINIQLGLRLLHLHS